MRPRILFVTTRVPHPRIGGFNLRVRGTIESLQKHYDVHLVCLTPNPPDPTLLEQLTTETAETHAIRYSRFRSATRAISRFAGKVPLLTLIYTDGGVSKWIEQNASSYDLMWCHLIRSAEFARKFPGPKILDMADAIGHHYSSAAPTGSFLWRKIRQIEAKKTTQYELDACRRFDRVYVHTDQDRSSLLEHDSNLANKVTISPMGIPDEFFKLTPATDPPQPDTANKVVFLGKMNYEPNIDAVEFFANDVLPLIQKQHENATFQIVGAYPTSRVLRLEKLPGVEVTGFVDKPAEYLASATVVVAPIRAGGGIQNKVIQAMALRKPVVTTSLGANGVGAAPGIDYLVADTPPQLATAVGKIFNDTDLAESIGQNGYEFVRTRFSWGEIGDAIHRDIKRLLARSTTPK